jgi:hypothetical protein
MYNRVERIIVIAYIRRALISHYPDSYITKINPRYHHPRGKLQIKVGMKKKMERH